MDIFDQRLCLAWTVSNPQHTQHPTQEVLLTAIVVEWIPVFEGPPSALDQVVDGQAEKR